MSFRFKIMGVILALNSVVIITVLWYSLGFLSEKMQEEVRKSNANAIYQLKQFSIAEAVLIEDYGKLIFDFEAMVNQLSLDAIVLYDSKNIVLASSNLSQVGEEISSDFFSGNHWEMESLTSGSQEIVYLAYRFNHDTLIDAINEALTFGLMLSLIGLLFMVAMGYMAGSWLSVRLERMVNSLDIITDGHIEKFTVDESKDEIGKLSRFVHAIGKKIALQKEEIIDSEDRMRLALQSADAGAWKYDVKLRDLTWTAKNYQILGLLPSDQQPSLELWFSFIHPDDQERVRSELMALFEDQKNLNIEYRIIRRSGDVRWVRSVGRIFLDENDKPVEAYGMLFDISLHKRDFSEITAEKKLLLNIFNHVIECIWVVDIKDDIIFANQKAKDYFHIPSLASPIPLSEIFSEETQSALKSGKLKNNKIVLEKPESQFTIVSLSSWPYQNDELASFTIYSVLVQNPVQTLAS